MSGYHGRKSGDSDASSLIRSMERALVGYQGTHPTRWKKYVFYDPWENRKTKKGPFPGKRMTQQKSKGTDQGKGDMAKKDNMSG